MADLKPCPFCGGSVQLNCNAGNPQHPIWWASCHNQKTCGVTVNIPNWFGITGEAIEKIWNTRTVRKCTFAKEMSK